MLLALSLALSSGPGRRDTNRKEWLEHGRLPVRPRPPPPPPLQSPHNPRLHGCKDAKISTLHLTPPTPVQARLGLLPGLSIVATVPPRPAASPPLHSPSPSHRR